MDPKRLTKDLLSGKLPARAEVVALLESGTALLASEPNIVETTSSPKRRFNIVGGEWLMVEGGGEAPTSSFIDGEIPVSCLTHLILIFSLDVQQLPLNSTRIHSPPDIHGQYFDLTGGVISKCGEPSATNGYLFNGDFVDRGSWGVECFLTLLSWKLAFPTDVYLTRGNHESEAMTSRYGFREECIFKYDSEIYKLFLRAFCALPLGLVLDSKVLALHGGLFSSDGVTLKDLNKVNRFQEPPHTRGSLMMEVTQSQIVFLAKSIQKSVRI